MTDKEKIESFGDMVVAAERLNKPWIIVMIVTNILWAIVTFSLVWFAYMTPIDSSQTQNLPDGSQSQSYSQGATKGN